MFDSTLNSRFRRSTMISRWSSPIPLMMVCPDSSSVWMRNDGSSAASFCRPTPNLSTSTLVFGKTKVDVERLGVGLQKLAAEDPSFRIHTDEESGQTIISGMGELHLEIIVDRLKREFKV